MLLNIFALRVIICGLILLGLVLVRHCGLMRNFPRNRVGVLECGRERTEIVPMTIGKAPTIVTESERVRRARRKHARLLAGVCPAGSAAVVKVEVLDRVERARQNTYEIRRVIK